MIVVEHDREMILSADHVIDMGPGAGIHGGLVVAYGNPEELRKAETLTSGYLNNKRKFHVPEERRGGNGKILKLTGARGHVHRGCRRERDGCGIADGDGLRFNLIHGRVTANVGVPPDLEGRREEKR